MKPDSNKIHPIPGYEKEIYVKPTVSNPNITVGEFTYIADSEFESHRTRPLFDSLIALEKRKVENRR